jgi:hypothetical protein
MRRLSADRAGWACQVYAAHSDLNYGHATHPAKEMARPAQISSG